MGIGYRTFIVSGDAVIAPVSQKTVDDFYLGGKPALKEYAGKTIDMVMVFYELKDRKPYRAFRFDSLRVKVAASGAMDRQHRDESLTLTARSLDGFGADKRKRAGAVIDASSEFYKRQREARHSPKISLVVTKRIVEILGL